MAIGRLIARIFYATVDIVPKAILYRLAKTPLVDVYRKITATLGRDSDEGYALIDSGPLQGKRIYVGSSGTRGYISVREYVHGTYEPEVCQFILTHVKPGMIVCDIGAHFGYFTILMSERVGQSGRCIAIEASNDNYSRIARTLRANAISNVSLEHIAASDQKALVSFDVNPNSLMGKIAADQTHGKQASTESVQAYDLDTFMSEKGISSVGFMKIDVEGAELKVLRGARHVLQQSRPLLLIEVHTFESADVLARPLIRDLGNAGYRITSLHNGASIDAELFEGGHIVAWPNV
jgi:FkbM family methyltransferase